MVAEVDLEVGLEAGSVVEEATAQLTAKEVSGLTDTTARKVLALRVGEGTARAVSVFVVHAKEPKTETAAAALAPPRLLPAKLGPA